MKKWLIFGLVVCRAAASVAQATYFNIQFDYNQYWNTTFDLAETDSSYLLIGGYGAPWANDSTYILQIDKQNAAVQLHIMGDYYGIDARELELSPDRPLAVVQGNFFEPEELPENTGFFIKKLNVNNLDSLSAQSYDLPGVAEYFLRMTLCADGGMALSGYTYETAGLPAKTLLFKCDSNLNQIFLKTYTHHPLRNSFGGGIAESSEQGFVVVGVFDADAVHRLPQIMLFDSLGALVWRKEIPYQGDEESLYLYDVIRETSGNYIAVGSKYFNPPLGGDYEKYWAICFDENGNILWSKENGNNDWSTWQRIAATTDGNYVICGYEKDQPLSGGAHKQYGVISKITPGGDLIWHRKYTMSSENKRYDVFYGITPTRDGGFLCAGSVWGDSIARQNAWIVKLDSLGCLAPGCSPGVGIIELPLAASDPILLFPNPATDILTVATQDKRPIECIQIYDVQGRLLIGQITAGAGQYSVDVRSAPPGVHFCAVRTGGVWFIRQLAVVR